MKAYDVFKLVFYTPLYAALMMTTALLTACAAPETMLDNSPAHAAHPIKQQDAQLMIKFTGTLSPLQVRHKLVAMSMQYHLEFHLIRAMSGGAYVMMVKGLRDADQLTALLQTIDQRPDVIYIEQDRRMQHFQNRATVPVY